MVIAALRTLTWGTVAAAVVSALLLAWAGGAMPRGTGLANDTNPMRASAAPQRGSAPVESKRSATPVAETLPH
jgi:hypothetical protein